MPRSSRKLSSAAVACLTLAATAIHAGQTLDQTKDTGLSPFGVGACNQTSQAWNKWIPQMAAIGVAEARTLRSGWGDVEPEEGRWNWNTLDRQLKDAASNRMDFTALLAWEAPWNTKDKPGSFPLNNISAWSTYCSEVVKHLKGKVKYFEVWNEPPNFCNDAPASDYAKIVVATYNAAKAANPDCQVGMATKSVHVNYLEQAIKSGAKDHFDYITVHPYEVLACATTGGESVYMHIVPTIRKMLTAQNPSKVNVPIWFTELGTTIGREGTAEEQGQMLVKAYTMGIAQGVACIQWFEGMDGDSGPMGMLESDGKPRPAYNAMAQTIKHLGKFPSYVGWVMLNNKDYGFVFNGAMGTVLATWAQPKTSDDLAFGQSVEIVDPLTGTVSKADKYSLTNAPIFVLGVPPNLVAQAKANQNKPFPWGGDYTNAQLISLTVGEANEEKGLHTRSGASVAADVVAYGGPARSGETPGGNVFVVDPNFLSYTATPIEITVVVRRNAANDNAGFKLRYESTSGFKNSEWNTVPDNKEWHTVSWKINDAQFVNYWGYNFALDSDGNQYNKYFIQSVTVKKLVN